MKACSPRRKAVRSAAWISVIGLTPTKMPGHGRSRRPADARHHRAQPAAPLRPLAGALAAGSYRAAVGPRTTGRRPGLRRAAGDHPGAGEPAAHGAHRRAGDRPGDRPGARRTARAARDERRIRSRRLRAGRPPAGSGAGVQRAAAVPGGRRRRGLVADADAGGAGRPDRRRHLRRARQALRLGAARRPGAGQPDTGLRPVRDRTAVGSRRAATESAYPPQCLGSADQHTARRGRSRVGQRRRPRRVRTAGAVARDAEHVAGQRLARRTAAPPHARRRLTVPWATVSPRLP